MKIFIFLSVFLLTEFSHAQIDRKGNGGDPYEISFKGVATNIEQWIRSGNASNLHLPPGITVETYARGMLAALSNYNISFTTDPLRIDGAEKACANFFTPNVIPEIICNSNKFIAIYENNIDDIYRLIHHEFAGIAGLEVNRGQDSDYFISDQITGYLRYERIRRLPINQVTTGFPKFRLSFTYQNIGHIYDSKKPEIRKSYVGLNLEQSKFNGSCVDVEFKQNEKGEYWYKNVYHQLSTSNWYPGYFYAEVQIQLLMHSRGYQALFQVKSINPFQAEVNAVDASQDLTSYLHLFSSAPYEANLVDQAVTMDKIYVMPQVVVASCL